MSLHHVAKLSLTPYIYKHGQTWMEIKLTYPRNASLSLTPLLPFLDHWLNSNENHLITRWTAHAPSQSHRSAPLHTRIIWERYYSHLALCKSHLPTEVKCFDPEADLFQLSRLWILQEFHYSTLADTMFMHWTGYVPLQTWAHQPGPLLSGSWYINMS